MTPEAKNKLLDIRVTEDAVKHDSFMDISVGENVNVTVNSIQYEGIFIAALPYSISVRYTENPPTLHISNDFVTPLIYVPELKKTFLGWECTFLKQGDDGNRLFVSTKTGENDGL